MIKVFMILEKEDPFLNVLKSANKNIHVTCFSDSIKTDLNDCSLNRLKMIVIDILHVIGISPKYRGYFYLKDAIILYYNSPILINSLYLGLSKKYNVSPSCIERGICRALEIGFTRNDIDVVGKIFGNCICCTRGCPTNLEAITTIVERIKYMI